MAITNIHLSAYEKHHEKTSLASIRKPSQQQQATMQVIHGQERELKLSRIILIIWDYVLTDIFNQRGVAVHGTLHTIQSI